jgi:hypothetical protein
MRPKITVITATTGRESLHDTIDSVKAQKNKCHHIVVYDGVTPELFDDEDLTVIGLPFRTGFNRWCGHKIYSGVGLMCQTPFVSFLDDDNTLTPDWSEVMLEAMYSSRLMPWAVTCRRHLWYNGTNIGVDKRESIGVNEYGYTLFDTNTFLIQSQHMRQLVPYFVHREHGDRIMSDFLVKNGNVLHIEYPLINYTLTEKNYKQLEKVVR